MRRPVRESNAYRLGWQDGRYGEPVCFTENHRLAEFQDPSERLDYYRGHRTGYEFRLRSSRLALAS